MSGETQRCWWLCPNAKCHHHVYQSAVCTVVNSKIKHNRSGCPKCHRFPCPCRSFGMLEPKRLKTFDAIRNVGEDPFKLSPNCNRFFWRICLDSPCKHHTYSTPLNNKHGCGFCSGGCGTGKVCSCMSFAKTHPRLLKDFDAIRNINANPYTISAGSDRRLWWNCLGRSCKHHNREVILQSRCGGKRCSLCVGGCATGIVCPCDSFAMNNPRMLKEFDAISNVGVNPYILSIWANQELWWICQTSRCHHHRWKASPNARSRSMQCSFCLNVYTCACNSFATKFPRLLKEFDAIRNIGLNPYVVAPGCSVMMWWICLRSSCKHHRWKATPNARTRGDDGNEGRCCSFCPPGRKYICPCDSLGGKHPRLLKEFDTVKNINVNPYKVAPGSSVPLYWICVIRGHGWMAPPSRRTGKKKCGCPGCKESFMEKEACKVLNELIHHGSSLEFKRQKTFDECRDKEKLPFDLYAEEFFERMLGELDGPQHFKVSYYYKTPEEFEDRKRKDRIKNEYARKNNFHLLRIAYSERHRIREHIISFLEAVRRSTSRVEMFIGEEYKTLTV